MDPRFHELRTLKANEALTAAERDAIPPGVKGTALGQVLLLLRGALAERGALLGTSPATVTAGLMAGRVLLATALSDAARGQWITESEWRAYADRYKLPAMTCTRLLGLLGKVADKVRREQAAAAQARQFPETLKQAA